MLPNRHISANWLAWLLVPLMALGGLRGQICWCDHDHGAGQGHGTASSEHDDELAHSGGHSHLEQAGHACHGHTPPADERPCHSEDADCGSPEDCQCVDLQAGAADRVAESVASDARKSPTPAAALSLAPSASLPQPVGFAYALKWQRVGRSHSPPLFLLNCTFLC